MRVEENKDRQGEREKIFKNYDKQKLLLVMIKRNLKSDKDKTKRDL